MKIVFLSHTHRKSVFKVGSSHLAREYNKMGHQILFISTPISFLTIGKTIIKYNRNKFKELKVKLSLIFGKSSTSNEKENIIDYVPFTFFPYTKLPISDSVFFAIYASGITYPSIKKVLKKYDFEDVDLVLMDDPSLAFMKNFIKAKSWVYRMTDIYSEMPNTQNSISNLEGKISNIADKFIATSKPAAESFEKKWNKKSIVFENGVDYSNFQGVFECPTEFNAKDKFRAIYIGSLDKRFNWNLVLESALKLPDVTFYIIGPQNSNEKANLPNIIMLGAKPYEEIPAYLSHSDIGLLPLEQGNSNSGRSPMKLYEYGASGLPVVATWTEELNRRKLPFVYLANNSSEFIFNIKEAIKDKEKTKNIAREISKKMSWETIANEILKSSQI